MLPTMKAVCFVKGLAQKLACQLNICSFIKVEDICVLTLGVEFIHSLEPFKQCRRHLLSTLRHVISTITNRHNNRICITTHGNHIKQRHSLNGGTISKPTDFKHYDSPVVLVPKFRFNNSPVYKKIVWLVIC